MISLSTLRVSRRFKVKADGRKFMDYRGTVIRKLLYQLTFVDMLPIQEHKCRLGLFCLVFKFSINNLLSFCRYL